MKVALNQFKRHFIVLDLSVRHLFKQLSKALTVALKIICCANLQNYVEFWDHSSSPPLSILLSQKTWTKTS